MPELKIFSDLSHPELAKEICAELQTPLGRANIQIFSNGNPIVEIQECVRGCDVFVIGTQAPIASENFVSFCILINALRYASARRITAVIPYLFESRSDKKDRPRIAIVSRLVAQMLETSGINRAIFIDLHAPQIQGFFRLPTDTINGAGLICKFLKQRDLSNYVIVAPDAGEAKKLHPFQELMPQLPLAMLDKRRYAHDEKPTVHKLIGDVGGKVALIIDDEISSGGTIKEAADFFQRLPTNERPSEIRVATTHPILSGNAMATLNQSGIKELIAINTVPVSETKKQTAQFEFRLLSPASIIARTIQIIHTDKSVGEFLDKEYIS